MANTPQTSSKHLADATQLGSKTKLPNGDINHEYRHPNDKDYVINVTTRNGKIMKSRTTYRPFKQVEAKRKQQVAAVKTKADTSKARRDAQLEKKRARSAKASNKQGNKTQR